MALYEISFTIRDAKNQTSVMTIYADSDDPCDPDGRGDVAQFAQDYAVMVDDMIDGQIIGIRASQIITLPGGIKLTPVATADVEDGAMFVWRTAVNTFKRQRVPTFSESLVNPNGTIQILFLPDDWLLMNTDPIELTADWIIAPTDERGADIVSLTEVKEDFKKSRKKSPG